MPLSRRTLVDGSEPTGPNRLPNDFDDVSLALLPRLITELVRRRTSDSGRNLVGAFEEEYGTSVPAKPGENPHALRMGCGGLGIPHP